VRKRAPQIEPVDINDAVRAAAALCADRARSAGIAVTLDLADGLPRVAADAVQIEQVVLNLMKNGLDAMEGCPPADGITVRTGPDDEGRVRVTVADRGHGLSVEARERLFDPFFTTKPDGMGLGLSICRTILESHGGHLWAADNPGGGVEMRFVLPAAQENPTHES
jgi:two-component system sensor histidine kinase TtrS